MEARAVSASLQLLITLAGVTLLFGCAQANGTMEGGARQVLRLCKGRIALLPPAYFLLAALLAMVGPGAILSTALLAPFAMTTGYRAGVPPFLIALMVANGANAGNMSPFSTVGAIVSTLMTQQGLGGHEYRVWFFHGAAHVAVAVAAYLLFGGLALFHEGSTDAVPAPPRMERRHALTLAVTALWIAGVALLRWPLGWSAFGAAAVLLLFRLASFREAIVHMPWKIIALVVGVSTGVSLIDEAGGFVWFQELFARLATSESVYAAIAFITGAISAYSSTSGVVLPAFLPLARGLAAHLPGVDPLALSISIVIGSALVDVSPLSTLGALCVAAAPEGSHRTALFRNLMIWGFAMAFVGAAICYLWAPLFSV